MSERIPLLDLEAQNGPLMPQLLAAMEATARAGRFILGPDVDGFEREIAAYIGAKHAIGVSSGTDALLVALMALDVGPGDEVVTTPFSFFATAGAIARLGAKAVFVDIDPVTYNLDPAGLEAVIGTRTKAILPVHLFGRAADLRAIRAVADARGLPILEDAAQSLGARSNLGPVGTVGTFGCFSFFPSKNLGCFGDGGLVTTGDDALAEKVRVLRAHGSKPKYFHALVGGNFRLDALQAAVLRVKLPHLDAWTAGRVANARRYDAMFRELGLPAERLALPDVADEGQVVNQYVIRTDRRDELQKALGAAGVETAIYYPLCLHRQACFADLGYPEGAFPHAERAAREVLALPVYSEIGAERQRRVVELVGATLTTAR